MKRYILTITLIIALVNGIAVFASDISDAEYYGVIEVSNNSTAASMVSTVATINTQDLIDGGYLNNSANNCAIISTSGGDIPFMPGTNSTNPWCLYVNSIGESTTNNYLLYTNASDGDINYFPGTSGMTTNDDDSIELSDNFTYQTSGFLHTDNASNKYILDKVDNSVGGIRIFIDPDVSGNITASIWNSANSTTTNYSPVSGTDYDKVDDPPGSPDDDSTYVTNATADWVTKGYWDLDTSSIANDSLITDVKVYFRFKNTGADNAHAQPVVKVGSSTTTGTDVTQGNSWATKNESLDRPGGGDWQYSDLADFTVAVKIRDDDGDSQCWLTQVYVAITYIPPVMVSITDVDKGEDILTVYEDGTHFWMIIGSESSANETSLAVPNNSINYTSFKNNAMPYVEYQKIWIAGELKQYIKWQYNDTTFTDLSSNDNDATPTFRTISSDADVSASLISFLPVAEADAPAYAISDAPDFITQTPTITEDFTTEPSGMFFGVDIFVAIAAASSTPVQWPLFIVFMFGAIVIGYGTGYLTNTYADGNLIIKIAILTAYIGLGIPLIGINFWMLLFFLILALATAMGSQHARSTGVL